MVELLTGFVLTLIALLIGYSLGKNQRVISPDVTRKINQIFSKVVPNSEVGPIERPTQQQNFYRDNPKLAQEQRIMEVEFDKLNL